MNGYTKRLILIVALLSLLMTSTTCFASAEIFGKNKRVGPHDLVGQVFFIPNDTEELSNFAKLKPVGSIKS